jgi:tetratricopeptide (TPR) repeat protein
MTEWWGVLPWIAAVVVRIVTHKRKDEGKRDHLIEVTRERVREGQWALALPLLSQLAEDPRKSDPPDLECLEAECLLALGRPNEAFELLRDADDQLLTSYDVSQRQFWLGEALRALGRSDEARAAYRTAQEADPRGTWAKRADARLAASGVYR